VAKEESPFSGSRFYRPALDQAGAKLKSIVMLHGSEGGSAPYIDSEASVLATLGYNVLVLCYFDCNRGINGPRQMLKNVEAKVVLDAVAWLRKQSTSNGFVAVYGFSRGAELALVAGALPSTSANKPDALIAHSPSDMYNGPVTWDWFEPSCWLCRRGQGQCPPGAPNSAFEWNLSCGEDKDPALVDFTLSAWLLNGRNIRSGERIPVERFSGPVLLTVGLKDEVWPADQTRRIESTLRAAGTKVQARYYPNGGHNLQGKDEQDRRQLVLDFLERL
jgi:dienelactone hydrolase